MSAGRERRRDSQVPEIRGDRQQQIWRLRDTASASVLKGRYGEALRICRELEALEPDEPAWARRAAYCCHRLGRRAEEFQALRRAAAGYERSGFLRKALAMYQLARALDPSNPELGQQLAELNAGRATGLARLQGPGKLQYLTPSELPPAPESMPAEALPFIRDARTGLTPPAPHAAPAEVDLRRLIDEYEVIEFAETDVNDE